MRHVIVKLWPGNSKRRSGYTPQLWLLPVRAVLAAALPANLHRDAPPLDGRWRSASTTSAKAAEDWRRLG
jgi:hypothetical protein